MLSVPFAVTIGLAVLPFMPPPVNFWLALLALLIGPGWGVLHLLFPPRALSLPESLLILILASIVIDTVLFAGLNALGVPLTILVVASVILATTYISAILAIFWGRSKSKSIISNTAEPDWLFFLFGLILVLIIAVVGTIDLNITKYFNIY